VNSTLTSPVVTAACVLRDRIAMPTDGWATRYNAIAPRFAVVPATTLTADFGPAHVDAKQAAPPRESRC
jgi:hypothetical protein